MFKDIVVKQVHKDNSLTDWNSSLRWLWKSDKTNWKVYSTETAGHWWDNRNLVQQQQKDFPK